MDLPIEPVAMTGGACHAPGAAHLLALLDGVRAGIVTVDRGLAIQTVNRRLGELLRIPAVAGAVRLSELLDGSAVLTEALTCEVDAALRGSICDGRERMVAIVTGGGGGASPVSSPCT